MASRNYAERARHKSDDGAGRESAATRFLVAICCAAVMICALAVSGFGG